MPKFVIEREIPGAVKLRKPDLKSISKKSCGVLSCLGPSISWIESFVTADKLYCVYYATDESLIRRTRRARSGLPRQQDHRRLRASSILQPPSRA